MERWEKISFYLKNSCLAVTIWNRSPGSQKTMLLMRGALLTLFEVLNLVSLNGRSIEDWDGEYTFIGAQKNVLRK